MRQVDLYRHFDAHDNLLYVGISFDAFKRLKEHRCSEWCSSIAKITIEKFDNRNDALNAEANAIRNEHPIYNQKCASGIVKSNQPEFKKTLVVSDIARLLKITRNTVYAMMRDGRIPVLPIPASKPPRWDAASIEAWLNPATVTSQAVD